MWSFDLAGSCLNNLFIELKLMHKFLIPTVDCITVVSSGDVWTLGSGDSVLEIHVKFCSSPGSGEVLVLNLWWQLYSQAISGVLEILPGESFCAFTHLFCTISITIHSHVCVGRLDDQWGIKEIHIYVSIWLFVLSFQYHLKYCGVSLSGIAENLVTILCVL